MGEYGGTHGAKLAHPFAARQYRPAFHENHDRPGRTRLTAAREISSGLILASDFKFFAAGDASLPSGDSLIHPATTAMKPAATDLPRSDASA
jgi:hypothetical protein